MAERRMFAKTVIDSDAFLDMPMSAQALYFHMAMRADDDGFLNNPKKIQRIVGASDDDAKILLAKRFIISFESGVIVIKHWKIHNYIQKDRYKPTVYQEEMAKLTIKDNGVYTECIQNGDTGKDSIGKLSIGKSKDRAISEQSKRKTKQFVPPTLEEVREYCRQRNSTVNPDDFFEYFDTGNWIDSRGKPVQNWKQKVLTWERNDNGSSKRSGNSPKREKTAEEWGVKYSN